MKRPIPINQLKALWQALREMSGDNAYDHYLQWYACKHPQVPLLSRKAFYRQLEERKWNGIRRCC
jgi:uncharacterized short protein YbdD (DUF466 family)